MSINEELVGIIRNTMIGYLQSIINENIILYVYTSSLTNLVIREREGGNPLLSSVILCIIMENPLFWTPRDFR